MKEREIVISGISGIFPDCENIREFEEKIFAGSSMVKKHGGASKIGSIEVPPFRGDIPPTNLDNVFFGIPSNLNDAMEEYTKWILTGAIEALCDAGINPENIRGTKTAVIISSMVCESENSLFQFENDNNAMLGYSRCMEANRLSYFLNLNGPSFYLEGSWLSSVAALEMGVSMLRKKQVQSVIIGASNKMVYPHYPAHFECMRRLNHDGKTKCFSADADGYSRSAGMVLFILQRAEDALRSYGTVVKAQCIAEMTRPHHIIDPCGIKNFISDFYSDVNINISDIGYIEGDGSASKALDAMELNGLAETLCKGRNKPLLVGSCKSKTGHCEGVAPLMGLLHAIFALKHSRIPPTINFSSPNADVPALVDGNMKVVTEATPLQGEYIGISSLNLTSIFGHVLLKQNSKTGPVREESYFPSDNIPRIFLISGREEESMKNKLEKIMLRKPIDENYFALNYKLFSRKIPNFLYRGFSVVNKKNKKSLKIAHCEVGIRRPVWYIFSGMGCQWSGMGTGIMMIPAIRRAIEKCHNTLLPLGVDLMTIVTTSDPRIFDNILNAFVGITAIQIGLVDLLEELGITPDGMVGHSTGELGCSYADKCLTAEQCILAAHARGQASNEANLVKGMMAAVGRGYNQIKDELPEGIEVACHNSNTSCTLSGVADIMEKYVEELKKRGVFARLVNVANIAYHSKHIQPASPILHKYLKEVIPEPKLRSKKWISSSVHHDKWDTDAARYCSAEYYTNNLLGHVLFEEATSHIPPDAICIEIAPHGLLQAIIKRSLPSCTHIPLNSRKDTGDSFYLIEALGNLYVAGLDPDFSKLYPSVEFPVPRETDFMDVVTWDLQNQSKKIDQLTKMMFNNFGGGAHTRVQKLLSEHFSYLHSSHLIHNNPCHMKSTILVSVIKYLEAQAGMKSDTSSYYTFENLKFWQDLPYSLKENSSISVMFQFVSSNFEVLDKKNNTIINGCLRSTIGNLPDAFIDSRITKERRQLAVINENEIYNFFEENGIVIKSFLRNISSVTLFENGFAGKIKWRNDTELYLDAVLKLVEFYSLARTNSGMALDQISQLLFDPKEFPKQEQEIDIYYDETIRFLTGPGIRMFSPTTKRLTQGTIESVQMKSRHFLPFSKINPENDFITLCLQIFKENFNSEKNCMEIIADLSNQTINNIIRDIESKDPATNYQIQISKTEELTDSSVDHCYLVIGNENMSDSIMKLRRSQSQFYFIYTGNAAGINARQLQICPILEQSSTNGSFVLYKQVAPDLGGCEFIKMPDIKENIIDAIAKKNISLDKTCFLLFRFCYISDIITAVQSTSDSSFYNKRLIFMDDSCPDFDPNNDFYKEQLLKHMKVNIAWKGVWGSLRDRVIGSQSNQPSTNYAFDPTFKNLRCKNVDLSVIGVNLKTLNYPNKHRNFSIIDYSGTKGGKQIFGLGRLIEDNCLDVDEHFCWEKPKHWTMEQAATVPLYYAMAYDMLRVKGRDIDRRMKSLLTHGGQTPLSQAIIRVALSLKMKVYVTCFTQSQKQMITKTFPELNESEIFMLDNVPMHFGYRILEDTDGNGVDIVIDSFEDPKLRALTYQCSSHRGVYYLLTHCDMDTDYAYGLSLVEKENSLTGYNAEMIFEMPTSDKQLLVKMMEEGIKSGLVKPLENYNVTEPIRRSQVANTVVVKSREEFPKKITIPLKTQNESKSENKLIKNGDKKSYIIIGGHNDLWYDMFRWLVLQGVNKIDIVLNQSQVSQHVKERYRELVDKTTSTNISLIEIENMKTAKNWNELFKNLNQEKTLDTVFFNTQGIETKLLDVDNALRIHGWNSCLVTLGPEATHIVETRIRNGLKGVSFILTSKALKKSTIVNTLDIWLNKCSDNDNLIIVQETQLVGEEGANIKTANIFPSSNQELIDLVSEASSKPCFVEIPTKSVDRKHAWEIYPFFLFPGLKLSKIYEFASRLIYPVILAKYPLVKGSIKEWASEFAKELISSYDQNLFTLVAEGWAGPLVLEVGAILEEHGKQSVIILLEGAPGTVKTWFTKTDCVLSSLLPTFKKGNFISINDLRSLSSKAIDPKDNQSYEKLTGLECLMNRLEMTESYEIRSEKQENTVFLFTADVFLTNAFDLKQVYPSFKYQIVESSYSFLEDPCLLEDVSKLALVEFRTASRRLIVENMSTLDCL